jgi:hypothetical protein
MKSRILQTLSENINRSTAALRLASLDYMHVNLFSVKHSLQSTLPFFIKRKMIIGWKVRRSTGTAS